MINLKTILFTGARSGIAKKVIDKFINNKNYLIYLTVENDNQLKSIARIYKNIDNVKYFKLNLLDESYIEVIEKLNIDILVCNAAIGIGGSIAEMDIDKMKENFEVNVFENFKLVQIVLREMLKRKNGRIIMISSLAGIMPIAFLGSYCATKASIIKLTECLKLELKNIDNNIKISLILPGMYHTGFNQVMLENKYKDMSNGYFKEELNLIRAKENLLFSLFEYKSLDSIVNKIYKAITIDNPKFIYSAPISQHLFAKLYFLIKY